MRLSEVAITVLRVSAQRAAWSRIAPTALIFSSLKHDQPMNDMTVGAVLKRMGPADLAPHGFWASFRNRAAELTDAPNHVALNMRGALDRKQSRSRVSAAGVIFTANRKRHYNHACPIRSLANCRRSLVIPSPATAYSCMLRTAILRASAGRFFKKITPTFRSCSHW